MARSMLIITRQSPWSGPSAREALDIVLAGGAFELPLGLLFLDDGVFQLIAAQQAARLEQKDLTANLQALPMFGIESLVSCLGKCHLLLMGMLLQFVQQIIVLDSNSIM